MTAPDTAARFADLLERHGADPGYWPEDDRAWALAYRAQADAAVLRDAVELDAALAFPVPPPTPALRIGILAAVAAEPRHASPAASPNFVDTLVALWRDLGGARLAGPALAMAMAAGIGLGWLMEPPTANASDATDDFLVLAQFDDHYMELTP